MEQKASRPSSITFASALFLLVGVVFLVLGFITVVYLIYDWTTAAPLLGSTAALGGTLTLLVVLGVLGVPSVIAGYWLLRLKKRGGWLALGLIVIGLVTIIFAIIESYVYNPPRCYSLVPCLDFGIPPLATLLVDVGFVLAIGTLAMALLREGWKSLV